MVVCAEEDPPTLALGGVVLLHPPGCGFFIGDRSQAGCLQLWRRIPQAYVRGHTFSDFWDASQGVFDPQRHRALGKASGQTAHRERWFNTLRQRLARFVRKTLSFSKSDQFHDLACRLFLHHYNLSCIS